MTDTTQEAVAADTLAPETDNAAAVEQEATTEQQAESAEEAKEESAPSEDSGDDSAEEAQPKKKGGGFQKRIDKLTTEKYEAEFRAKQLEQRLQEIERKLAPAEVKAPGDVPKLDDFNNLEEYQKALIVWNNQTREYAKQEAIREAEEANQAKAAELKAIEAQARLNSRLEQSQKKYADFNQAVAPLAPIMDADDAIREYIMESEAAGELTYQLAKNPAELLRITQLSGLAKIKELMRLEERIKAPPPAKPLTKAPNPIKPVGANEKPALSLDDLPMNEYVKRMNAEERKRKGYS